MVRAVDYVPSYHEDMNHLSHFHLSCLTSAAPTLNTNTRKQTRFIGKEDRRSLDTVSWVSQALVHFCPDYRRLNHHQKTISKHAQPKPFLYFL